MAILVNMGQRGFVLKEGYLKPGDQITVDQETADKLSKVYPNEIKVVVMEKPAVKEEPKEMPKEEPKEEKPVRRGRPKKVQE